MPADSKHPEYSDNIEIWEDCRNVYAGERVVKKHGGRYLPKPEKATQKEFQNYVMRAFFFPAMERTVAGLSGAIDRKPPTYEMPDRMVNYLEKNVTGTGMSIRQFAKSCTDEVFITGRCGVLVDVQTGGGEPYLTLYKAEDIINWDVDEDDNVILVVLREHYYDRSLDDVFARIRRKRYRVLRLDENNNYVQEVYKEFSAMESVIGDSSRLSTSLSLDGESSTQPTKSGKPLDFIPFVFINSRTIKTDVDKPPLLDLVTKSLEYYRVGADYANSLYFTGSPIFWTKGAKRPAPTPGAAGSDPNAPSIDIVLGSTRAIDLGTNDNAQIGICEYSGQGVTPCRDKCNDIKEEMARLGARLLEGQRRGVEAAETAQLNEAAETSTLQSIVVNVSSGIRRAFEYCAIWLNLPFEEIEFDLNDDFIDITLNPQVITVIMNLVEKELISYKTFYYIMSQGELTRPGIGEEEELQNIASQPPRFSPDPNDLSGLNLPNDGNQEIPGAGNVDDV